MDYVMSDIHGYYGRFLQMLKRINFSASDTLYIAGDVIDRGSHGIELLQYIQAHSNIHMVMGNHEHMMLCYLKSNSFYINPYNSVDMRNLWYSNGGEDTLYAFNALSTVEQSRLLDYVGTLPYSITFKNKGRKVRIVHAYPANKSKFPIESEYINALIWTRVRATGSIPLSENELVFLGHTPTIFYLKNLPMLITEVLPNVYNVDCGMASEVRSLGCICVDTMQEYYV